MAVDEAALRQQWDAGAYEDVMTAALDGYGAELFGFLVGLTGDHDRAGDVFGAVCERAWKGLPRLRWESSLRVWLYAIARNEFLRAASRTRRDVPLSRVPSVEVAVVRARTATSPHLRTEVKAGFAKLRAALAPDDHMLLGLRLDRGLAWNDIARVLGDGDPAHLARDAAALRKRYERLKARLRELASSLVTDDG